MHERGFGTKIINDNNYYFFDAAVVLGLIRQNQFVLLLRQPTAINQLQFP